MTKEKLCYVVRNNAGSIVGRLAFAEDAAALASAMGEGANIKVGKKTVWTEAKNERAGMSFDNAARVIHERIHY
jgi:hypothetical protein